MAKNERIEDLGKLSILIKQARDHDMWDIKSSFSRDKDFAEIFLKQTPDKQFDDLHDLAYNMSSLNDLLYKMQEISDGDEVNGIDDR